MTRYQPEIDLDAISAIDMHVHIEQDDHGHLSLDPMLMDASEAYFKGSDNRTPTVGDIAARYRASGMAAVVFTVDATTALGRPAISSEEIATRAADEADVVIPFGSVDPRQGERAIDRARSLVQDYGVRGFKFHPSLQAFDPTDPALQPLWSALQDLGVPALFHTGQNGIGAGLPGGRGIKLRYSNPLLLDDVAADFPGLTVIMAHPSVPWQVEAISITTHKSNVFIDLSGWRPKYFPPELIRAAGGMLHRKVLFGTDYPLISPERWLADFAELGIKPERHEYILKSNAVEVLGLG
ncbi:amidohydrolase family protein [Gordonia sp. SL306]|uniref:amidohydrolase family protein n=1 Tax=Gordonia sp. SL306 TaxID=2995145 RepID=UPI00227170B7|nr:amidohydrolase family protein [Gordonia sp. SL306]WAC54550.1 amidohydrolase family protein [Gordonia sp. SL306]